MTQANTRKDSADTSLRSLRILVVDDAPVLLEGLCQFLRTQARMQVVGTAQNGLEALDQTAILEPDLVLMDLRMPFLDGLKTTAILRRRFPNTRVIIMTMEDSHHAEAAARAQGADGFVAKMWLTRDLMQEICRVLPIDCFS